MSLLQVQIDDNLKQAIKDKSELYGVSASSLVKIVLVKAFLTSDVAPGNVFNADRDNASKGISVDDLIDQL